jgi:NADH dehydrogenase
MQQQRIPRVVIVGGGFGGLNAARALEDSSVEVILIDRRNHHLFQPLLYQVATAALSPADIATPIRKVLKNQVNATVMMAGAQQIDTANRLLVTDVGEIEYDYLILATGATHSYFSNSQWAPHAPGLKTIDDATEIRRRFLLAFESAELESDPDARGAALTFVVVGAGPTGVELAGALAEIAHETIPRDFHHVDTTTARVILVEGEDRVLPAMDRKCSGDALESLRRLGVEVRLGSLVTGIDETGVDLGAERIPADNVFWAAGVQASPLGSCLEADLDDAGRVIVNDDLSLSDHPEVFVVGDLAHVIDPATGAMVPGVAQGAIQGGRHVAGIIASELEAIGDGRRTADRPPFRYHDKGTLATIGRNKAVADLGRLKFRGFPAWFLWAVVHVMFLVSTRNRLAVMFDWLWNYLFFDRGARLITGPSKVRLRRSLTEDMKL